MVEKEEIFILKEFLEGLKIFLTLGNHLYLNILMIYYNFQDKIF